MAISKLKIARKNGMKFYYTHELFSNEKRFVNVISRIFSVSCQHLSFDIYSTWIGRTNESMNGLRCVCVCIRVRCKNEFSGHTPDVKQTAFSFTFLD